MAYQKQTWQEYDDTKTELQNINNGAVATPERLNHIENGIANSADKAEVTAQLQQIDTAIVSFIFDDGYQESTLTRSIFNDYGFKCGFALVNDWLTTRSEQDSLSNFLKYQNEGHTLLSHSNTHLNMSGDTVAMSVAKSEIVGSEFNLNRWGYQVRGYVSPSSATNEKYMDYITQTYDYAFTKYTGVLPSNNVGHVTKNADPFRLGRISLFSNELEDIFEAIDRAIEAKGLLFFYDHRVGYEGNHVSEAKVRSVLAYLKTKTDEAICRVLAPDDAIATFFSKELKTNQLGPSQVFVPLNNNNLLLEDELPSRVWLPQYCENIPLNTYLSKPTGDGATLDVLVSGFYCLNFNSAFEILSSNPTSTNSIIVEVGYSGWQTDPNSASRRFVFFNRDTDVVTIDTMYNIYLAAGQKLYVKIFVENNGGVVKQLRKSVLSITCMT